MAYDLAGLKSVFFNDPASTEIYPLSLHDALPILIDPLTRRTTTVYDLAGRSVAVINPLGFGTNTVYDAANEDISTIDPLSPRTTTSYYLASRRVGVMKPPRVVTETR